LNLHNNNDNNDSSSLSLSTTEAKAKAKEEDNANDVDLNQLAKRALLVVDQDDGSMRDNVADMMGMIRQIKEYIVVVEDEEENDSLLQGAYSHRTVSIDDAGKEEEEEQLDSRNVFESFLRPKTTLVGGHSYFCIATATATANGKKQ
jgi:hypothetical protein